jgi:hypothetical protein
VLEELWRDDEVLPTKEDIVAQLSVAFINGYEACQMHVPKYISIDRDESFCGDSGIELEVRFETQIDVNDYAEFDSTPPTLEHEAIADRLLAKRSKEALTLTPKNN